MVRLRRPSSLRPTGNRTAPTADLAQQIDNLFNSDARLDHSLALYGTLWRSLSTDASPDTSSINTEYPRDETNAHSSLLNAYIHTMSGKAQTHARAMSKGVAWDLDVLDVFVLFGPDMSKSSLALDALRVLALDVHAPDFAVAMAEIRFWADKRKSSEVVLPRLSKTAPFTAWDVRGALATICGEKRSECEICTKATKRWKAGGRGVASVGGERGEDAGSVDSVGGERGEDAGSVDNNSRDRLLSGIATPPDKTHGHDEITSARRASMTGGSQGDGTASTELTAAGGARNGNASAELTAAGGERTGAASINGDVFDNITSAGGEAEHTGAKAIEEDEDDGAEDVEQVRTAAGPLPETSPGSQQEEHDDVSHDSDYHVDLRSRSDINERTGPPPPSQSRRSPAGPTIIRTPPSQLPSAASTCADLPLSRNSHFTMSEHRHGLKRRRLAHDPTTPIYPVASMMQFTTFTLQAEQADLGFTCRTPQNAFIYLVDLSASPFWTRNYASILVKSWALLVREHESPEAVVYATSEADAELAFEEVQKNVFANTPSLKCTPKLFQAVLPSEKSPPPQVYVCMLGMLIAADIDIAPTAERTSGLSPDAWALLFEAYESDERLSFDTLLSKLVHTPSFKDSSYPPLAELNRAYHDWQTHTRQLRMVQPCLASLQRFLSVTEHLSDARKEKSTAVDSGPEPASVSERIAYYTNQLAKLEAEKEKMATLESFQDILSGVVKEAPASRSRLTEKISQSKEALHLATQNLLEDVDKGNVGDE